MLFAFARQQENLSCRSCVCAVFCKDSRTHKDRLCDRVLMDVVFMLQGCKQDRFRQYVCSSRTHRYQHTNILANFVTFAVLQHEDHIHQNSGIKWASDMTMRAVVMAVKPDLTTSVWYITELALLCEPYSCNGNSWHTDVVDSHQ